MYSFKKYSWLISAVFAIIVFISGLTANDISFLPNKYQSIAVGVIGACALQLAIVDMKKTGPKVMLEDI